MDAESILIKCAAFTAEVCLTCYLYNKYRSYSECLESLKQAQCLELDGDLKKHVEKHNGEIKYAVISGKVRALSTPLSSQYIPYLAGVIREKITVERKIKWNPFLGIWGSANHDLMQSVNFIPFAISGKAGGLFKKSASVEVLEPLTARELTIPTVYDEFTCHHDSIGDAVFGVIRGEKTLGIQEIERMLCENEALTAVGKLVIENNRLKIKPPDDGLTYFLTPLSLESLISKINLNTKVFKVTSTIMVVLTFALIGYFTKRAIIEIRNRIRDKRERKKWEEQRRIRRMADTARKQLEPDSPKCVICLENPVEIFLLECGHACLCYDCSENVSNLCPVCRLEISRKVALFWP